MLFRSVLSLSLSPPWTTRRRRRRQFVRACDGMSPLNFRSREYKEERRRVKEKEMDVRRETQMDPRSPASL